MGGATGVESDHASVAVDGASLTLSEVELVARGGAQVELDGECLERVEASSRAVGRMVAAGEPVYGVNTGFGALSNRAVEPSDVTTLQHNLLRSHASGTGPLLDAEAARAVTVIRANSLAVGASGVRPVVIQRLIDILNAGIVPAIPEQGSLGASGDLAPLAHLALVLTGEGYVVEGGEAVPAGPALERAGIAPLALEAKEALALINGTAFIAGVGALTLQDAERLLLTAIAVAALTAYAIGARREPFDPRLHQVRPHYGQLRVAKLLETLLGPLDPAHRATERVQDPYSIRCLPPAFGAALDALGPLQDALEVELNAATDNPLIFENDALSGGNFHGHPLALPIEYAKVGVASVGTMTERRIALLMDAGEYGLPAFLVANPGLNSGFMIAHYLTAGLVAENKVLAHPSAVDSVPTSANIEDFNSMGATAARHFRDITRNVERIVAVEALCAAQACDVRGIRPDGALGELYAAIRDVVPMLERDDRVMADDIEAVWRLIHAGELAGIAWKGAEIG